MSTSAPKPRPTRNAPRKSGPWRRADQKQGYSHGDADEKPGSDSGSKQAVKQVASPHAANHDSGAYERTSQCRVLQTYTAVAKHGCSVNDATLDACADEKK